MIELPPVLAEGDLLDLDAARTVVWATPRGAAWLCARHPGLTVHAMGDAVGEHVTTIVAVGGGTLLDEAKLARRARASRVRLVAVPTIWGSGAEASPVAVVDREGRKVIEVDDSLLPDAMVHVPELARTVPVARAREACGDVWAHALEGFASPLASAELRVDLAALLSEMTSLPLGPDPRWFRVGALACAGQARSSVGLVHGIAHVLEEELADPSWHHARLCAAVLHPVLSFDCTSPKWAHLFEAHSLALDAVQAVALELFDTAAWAELLPHLEAAWPRIVRDRLTRTNATMVRPGSLEFFQGLVP